MAEQDVNLDRLDYYTVMTWQLQDAKNKLSELVEISIGAGPQIISRRGKDTAAIISYAQYQNLTKKRKVLSKH